MIKQVRDDARFASLRVRGRLRRSVPDAPLRRMAGRLAGADALEIGGPSTLFASAMPVYDQLSSLTMVNYADETIWDGVAQAVTAAASFVSEASDLRDVPDKAFDALLASHVLEHLADPLGALAEWRRVLRPTGQLLLVVPHREGTFDHRRPITDLDHLRKDAAVGQSEDDTTHLAEVLALHDHRRDTSGLGGPAGHAQRVRSNALLRSVHHHVFDTRATAAVIAAAAFDVEAMALRLPYHVIVVARPSQGAGEVLIDLDALVARSPFPRERSGR